MLGGIGSSRRRGRQRMRWLDCSLTRWTWVWVNSGRWWWTGRPGVLRFMGSQRVGHDWATELNWNWTDAIVKYTFDICSWYVWYLWYLFCKILFTSNIILFPNFQYYLMSSYSSVLHCMLSKTMFTSELKYVVTSICLFNIWQWI